MKQRVITAICLLAIVLPLLWLGGNFVFALVIAATTIATWEMLKMRNKKVNLPLWVVVAAFSGVSVLIFTPSFRLAMQMLGIILFPLLLVGYLRVRKNKDEYSFIILTIMYLGVAFRSLLLIRHHSLMLFLFLITTVILTDSAAYFAGRLFGKRKLAPSISPNKTIAGAVGGLLIGALFAIIFGVLNSLFVNLWILIMLAVGIPILGQVGDLVASALKRQHDIKDYSNIFPGHGGVMDRIDSQMLAAILLYVVILLGGVS